MELHRILRKLIYSYFARFIFFQRENLCIEDLFAGIVVIISLHKSSTNKYECLKQSFKNMNLIHIFKLNLSNNINIIISISLINFFLTKKPGDLFIYINI